MYRLLLVLLICAGLLADWAQAQAKEVIMSVISVTQADRGKSVVIQQGQTLAVVVSENPSTGFRWTIDRNDDAILALRNSDYVMFTGSNIGGGGQRTFVFTAQQPGSVHLQLKLWREWEGDASVIERFDAAVEVRSGGVTH